MSKQYNFIPEALLIILAWLTVFLKLIPIMPAILLAIAVMLLRIGMVGFIYLSFMHLSVFWGFFRNVSGIPIPGMTWRLLAIISLIIFFSKRKTSIPYLRKGLLAVMAVLLFFCVSSLTTSGGNYAITKLENTLIYALASYFSFTILFVGGKEVEYKKIAFYLIILGIFLLRLGSELSGGMPSSIYDFGFLRSSNDFFSGEEEFLVSYHLPPFLALHGFSLLFIRPSLQKGKQFLELCLLAMCTLICLYSGARQFIVIAILFLALWSYLNLFKGGFSMRLVIVSFIVVVISIGYTFIFGDDGLLTSTINEGYMEGSGRGPWIIQGINYFLSSPINGIGYGRYSFMGDYGQYPHNMIVELLCETGIIGLLFFFALLIYHIKKSWHFSEYYVFLLLVFFIRSMASGGLDTNIAVLTLSIATCSLILQPAHHKNF